MTRVVLVTGAGRGIGRAVALAFAGPGTAVAVNYRSDREAAEGVVAEIAARGGEAEAVRANVADLGQVRSMVEAVAARHGRIDVLVNNAGGNRDAMLAMMDPADWDAVLDANLRGVFNCCRSAVRLMMAERRGAIVNVSSVSAGQGLPGQTSYAAAKGGVDAFTRTLAREVASFGIRVNAVAPGLVESRAAAAIPAAQRERLLSQIPMRRMGTAGEVAAVVRFLASDDASYITGEIIKVAGGL